MEDVLLTHKTPPTGEIVPGTVGNVCFEVRNSEVRSPVASCCCYRRLFAVDKLSR